MAAKRIFQSLVVVAILAASFASPSGVLSESGCPSYIVAQGGDTLDDIAAACGVSVEAIQAGNPGIGSSLVNGQVLYIPTGFTSAAISTPPQTGVSTYIIQAGDTLDDIAVRNGVYLSDILALNPQILNVNTISPGQVINLPSPATVQSPTDYASTYPPTDNFSTDNLATNTPSTYNPSTYYPTPTETSQPAFIQITYISVLKIAHGKGLLVRTGPGTSYSLIHSPYVSAVNRSYWWYRKNSVTVDSTGLVWVEIELSALVNGYSTGWIMVKDSIGNYYTVPHFDP